MTHNLPQYVRVHEEIVRGLAEGRWRGGDLLPSESELAAEFGVSIGTVRKAMDEVVGAHLARRQQGKGTYVSKPDYLSSMGLFSRLMSPDGKKHLPVFKAVLSIESATSNSLEQASLQLNASDRVYRVRRLREFQDGTPMVEYLSLPKAVFPRFDAKIKTARPQLLYGFYDQVFGVVVTEVCEQARAVGASEPDAAVLGCQSGAALLEIQRIAFTYRRRPVELRISRCRTDKLIYGTTLAEKA